MEDQADAGAAVAKFPEGGVDLFASRAGDPWHQAPPHEQDAATDPAAPQGPGWADAETRAERRKEAKNLSWAEALVPGFSPQTPQQFRWLIGIIKLGNPYREEMRARKKVIQKTNPRVIADEARTPRCATAVRLFFIGQLGTKV